MGGAGRIAGFDRGGSLASLRSFYVLGTKRYDLPMAVGNYASTLRSYRDGSWVRVAASNGVICTYGNPLRLQNLPSKKTVWFRFCGCGREVGSKSSTKHTLSS
jgi:hypothetical protein